MTLRNSVLCGYFFIAAEGLAIINGARNLESLFSKGLPMFGKTFYESLSQKIIIYNHPKWESSKHNILNPIEKSTKISDPLTYLPAFSMITGIAWYYMKRKENNSSDTVPSQPL